jgi:hypothetical protein
VLRDGPRPRKITRAGCGNGRNGRHGQDVASSTVGLEGIVSKRKGSPYRSGRSPDWLKMKNPDAPAVKREAEEDWFRS